MTKHLKPHELSAHQDGMLAGIQRARAEAHLATCAECRAALERMVGLEHTLAEQIAHDPGESYFRSFASRVEARIRPAGAPKLGPKAPPGDSFWTWLNTPVGMSWAGAAAVLVVGAGVSLITVRTISPPHAAKMMARREATVAAQPPAPSAPSAAGSLAQTNPPASPAPGEAQATTPAAESSAATGSAAANGAVADEQAASPAPESAPSRAVEMKQLPNGESAPVERRATLAPAPSPGVPANLQAGAPVKARKNVVAQPLAAQASSEKDAGAKSTSAARSQASSSADAAGRDALSPPGLKLGNAPATTSQRCGAVRDPSGHAVAGAQLMLVETGSSAQSRSDGSFCLDVSSAARTLVVMAVGFEAQRMTLDPGDQGPLMLTLRAVSVVGGGAGSASGAATAPSASRWVQKPGASSPAGGGGANSASADAAKRSASPVGSTESFASLSDSVRTLALKALQFENDAARLQSAEQYALAGQEWQKVLKRTSDTPAEDETRFRIAAAYYKAWHIDPSHARSVIALEAISSFVLRAPSGTERDQATMWLGQLRWDDPNSASH